MEELQKKVLNQWLNVEFYAIANKARLIDKKYDITAELIQESVRCLDYETSMKDVPDVNYVITIIGLMWEHLDLEKYDIRPMIITFLSRIGYPTSAIICDEGFDKNTCSFTKIDSMINQITATLNQERSEVYVQGQKYLLTAYQKEIWDSMNAERIIGISAPTSAGKSFVILLNLIKRLSQDCFDIVYIVPTLSLVNQVTKDFSGEIKNHGIKNCHIVNSFDENTLDDLNYIYVLTQEKAIAAFSEFGQAFTRKMVLVVDEIQNIERIEDATDERAKILFDTLVEFRYKENVDQIIISGPRIEEIGTVGETIFGEETKNHTTSISPVLNLTYSIKKKDDFFYLKQYCALTDNVISDVIVHSERIQGYGQTMYTDKYLEYLGNMVASVGNESQNIIFAPTARSARKIAMSLSTETDVEDNGLMEYYRETIHPSYSLCKTLAKGVAYHHGKLPMHVRSTLENAISMKMISNVVCTTTLLQGVNLPAQNVFIRNPHLYVKQQEDSAELTNYEMANLRGRAGRLLKDYVGRTFVLDEDGFAETEGYDQLELFDDVSKELSASYEEKFEQYRQEIEDVLISNTKVDDYMKKYGYLVSYIRQSILRYGEHAKSIMSNVGINLSKEQVAAIKYKMDDLSVPKEICYKNRYWDPLALEDIYVHYDGGVPNHPSERGAKAKFDRMMKFLRDNQSTKGMYQKYIPEKYREGINRKMLKNLCFDWAKEEKLKTLLERPWGLNDDEADKIEDIIGVLQNTVSYGVPLLLKPVFDINKPDNAFLSCLQSGTNNEITRSLVELGIARETAIYLYENIFTEESIKDKDKIEVRQVLCNVIRERYSDLPYWIQIQVDFIV